MDGSERQCEGKVIEAQLALSANIGRADARSEDSCRKPCARLSWTAPLLVLGFVICSWCVIVVR